MSDKVNSGILAEFEIYFSYNQFMVSDETVSSPGCDWTENHFKQGFARRSTTVSFRTIWEFGRADTKVHFGEYVKNTSHERVVAVPFYSPTGIIVVEGPEEYPVDRKVRLCPGHYKLIAAQQAIDDGEEIIELYFQPLIEPALNSEIIIKDDELDPPKCLIEQAEIAEV